MLQGPPPALAFRVYLGHPRCYYRVRRPGIPRTAQPGLQLGRSFHLYDSSNNMGLVGTGSRVGLWKRQDRGTNPGYYLIAERKNGIEFYNEATTAPVGLLEAQVASIATGVWSTISVFCLCPIKVCGEWYEKRSAFMHLVSTDIGGKVLGQAERRAWWRLLCNMSHREKTRHFSAHAGSATTTARKLGHAHCVAHMHQRSKVIKSPPTRGAGLSKPLPAGMQAGRLVVPTQRSQGKRRR